MVAEAGPRREKPDDGDVEHTAEFKNILKEVEELGSFKASFLEVSFCVVCTSGCIRVLWPRGLGFKVVMACTFSNVDIQTLNLHQCFFFFGG